MFSSSLWPTASVFVGLQSEKLLTPFDLRKNVAFYLFFYFFHFLTGGQRDKAFKRRPNPSSNTHKCPAILDCPNFLEAVWNIQSDHKIREVWVQLHNCLFFLRGFFPFPARVPTFGNSGALRAPLCAPQLAPSQSLHSADVCALTRCLQQILWVKNYLFFWRARRPKTPGGATSGADVGWMEMSETERLRCDSDTFASAAKRIQATGSKSFQSEWL